MFVGFQDGAIHADSKTEIVGIDDQAAHRASLAGTCGWRTGVPPVLHEHRDLTISLPP
jgi:hypothetical protein